MIFQFAFDENSSEFNEFIQKMPALVEIYEKLNSKFTKFSEDY